MKGPFRKQLNGKWEIEFTAGVWTDVTADVDQRQQVPSIRFGRTSEFSAPQQATLTVALRNFKRDANGAPVFDANHNYVRGNYTPQDTSSPYYPNIQPRKRIRYSYNPGVQRFRFTGYIHQWQPIMVDGSRPYMVISALDRLDQLSRVSMLSPIRQEITLDVPAFWWPLADAAGSTSAAEQSGNSGPSLGVAGTQANPLIFGDVGPGFGDGTGVHFAPGSLSSGQYLTVTTLPNVLSGGVVQYPEYELWVQLSAAPASTVGVLAGDLSRAGAGNALVIGIDSTGKPTVTGPNSVSMTGSASIADGGWHHIYLHTGTTYNLYVDGSLAATQGSSGAVAGQFTYSRLAIGQTALEANSSALFTGNIGQVAVYPPSLSTTRITAHYQAGLGYVGDTTDARIARWLGYAGLTSSDWALDAGQTTVGTYPQAGKDVLSACQDIALTEGGGAVLYVTPDGKVTFRNRRYRDPRSVDLTLIAADDFDGTTYTPSFDDLNLVTSVTVNRDTEAGTQTSQTYTNTASQTTFGPFTNQITSYATSDIDALSLAQYDVNMQATPALRFPQIGVDLAIAGHDLFDAVGQLGIGDRIRLTAIPSVAYPVSQLDFFIEGWTETPDAESYKVVFDVSPADNPPRALWDVSTWDGGDAWAL